MGRKALIRERKTLTSKSKKWLNQLLIKLQYEDLEALTVDNIAALANKSKSTIYSYFESKEEILATICQLRVNDMIDGLTKIDQGNERNVDLYTQLIELFATGTEGISILFLQSIKKNYPSAWQIINQFTDQFIDLLKHHYQKGIADGEYNAVSVELLGSIDKLFIIQVVTNPDIFSDDKYSVSKLVRDYLNIRLIGLLKR